MEYIEDTLFQYKTEMEEQLRKYNQQFVEEREPIREYFYHIDTDSQKILGVLVTYFF